ncbi:MAG: hypothetical protein K2X01_10735 [Cyanobacteria bacterium]|nr:hypothetical protein [Cyanobacteriota bacterium]
MKQIAFKGAYLGVIFGPGTKQHDVAASIAYSDPLSRPVRPGWELDQVRYTLPGKVLFRLSPEQPDRVEINGIKAGSSKQIAALSQRLAKKETVTLEEARAALLEMLQLDSFNPSSADTKPQRFLHEYSLIWKTTRTAPQRPFLARLKTGLKQGLFGPKTSEKPEEPVKTMVREKIDYQKDYSVSQFFDYWRHYLAGILKNAPADKLDELIELTK